MEVAVECLLEWVSGQVYNGVGLSRQADGKVIIPEKDKKSWILLFAFFVLFRPPNFCFGGGGVGGRPNFWRWTTVATWPPKKWVVFVSWAVATVETSYTDKWDVTRRLRKCLFVRVCVCVSEWGHRWRRRKPGQSLRHYRRHLEQFLQSSSFV